MASINAFCDYMRTACNVWNLGYDQGNRWDVRNGGECDCSSLVITALKSAGFDVGSATYTGNMSANLCARGWKRVTNNGAPQKGDILLNDVNHVAVWLGDCLAQASIDERGNISGGASGDQTGNETNTRSYYNYPWNCYLRYTGASTNAPSAPSATASKPKEPAKKNGQPIYNAMVNGRWLDAMQGKIDSGGSSDDYAGQMGIGIQFLGIEGVGKYRVCSQSNGWLPYVSKRNLNDLDNGCAGDGSAIIAVEIPNSSIKYQVHTRGGGWLDWMIGTKDTGGSSDTFAGEMLPIDAIRIVKI